MKVTEDTLERALSALLDSVRETDVSAMEHREARTGFSAHVGGVGLDAIQAERRADEWFLLERHSQAFGGVPVEVAVHGGLELDAEEADEDTLAALVGSITGVFEITGVNAGEGVWVRDLLAFGEHPLIEPEGSRSLEVGDLLVGRLFPVGDGLHRISRAAGVFRNEELKAALKVDLERARGARRGVLRLASPELERMFWGASPAAETERAATEARAVLVRGGLGGEAVQAIFERLKLNPPDGRILPGGTDEVGEVLAELAFETEVDLDRARKALLALWGCMHAAPPSSAGPAGAGQTPGASQPGASAWSDRTVASPDAGALTPQPAPGRAAPGPAETAGPAETGAAAGTGGPAANQPATSDPRRAAMEAFDRGRAEGRDLEELFAELERDLDLETEDPAGQVGFGAAQSTQSAGTAHASDVHGVGEDAERPEDIAPDFPGVVGAMVEEFLWELGSTQGVEVAKRHEVLRKLSVFAEPIGLFEELGERELLSFAAVWLPQWGELESPDEAAEVLTALRNFCDWVTTDHELPLRTAYDAVIPALESSLPRVVRANGSPALVSTHDDPTIGDWFVVAGADGDFVDVESGRGVTASYRVGAPLARHLASGDLIRAESAAGELRVYCVYPPEARELSNR